MNTLHCMENGLNVDYIGEFLDKVDADRYFAELRTLPFYRPTLKIRGKDIKPKRQVLAYGDLNTCYEFSGTYIPAEPWTPLMIELRDKVEKQTACTYNYVLLNMYPDGKSFISHHKDNESCLNTVFPTAVLSFGAQRTLEFKRRHVPTTRINLEHGSFYGIMKPTNELFTHGIPADPTVQDMRISLTFRHLISHPLDVKKPRLETLPKDPCLDLFAISPSPKDDSPPTYDSPLNKPNFTLSPTPLVKTCLDELPDHDWFSNMFQQTPNPIIASWDLAWNTFVQVVMEKNCSLKIHIRNFKETAQGECYPTKNGIVMTCATFNEFQNNLSKFHFFSVKDTFVSNNQLLTAFIDEDYCLLQQMFKTNNHSGYYFKPEGLRLSKDQFLKLNEFCPEITDCLMDTILMKVIPQSILCKTSDCRLSHITLEQSKAQFLTCFNHELEMSIHRVYQCYGCRNNQLEHNCLNTSLREKFLLYRDSALLCFNVNQFVKKLIQQCTCHLTHAFFKTLSSDFFVNYLETLFINKSE